MLDLIVRCSALGPLMTEPLQIDARFLTPEVEEIVKKKKRSDEEKALITSLKEQCLSVGAKSQVRLLVKQDLFGFDYEVSSKEREKGIEVEAAAIELLNRVRGLALAKNTERRTSESITGECDIFNAPHRRGHDIKCPWSLASFPIAQVDCEDNNYWWQMQGYMLLWDADEWSVDYVMMPTPERLISRYEPRQMHEVDHIPERLRITSWVVKRDPDAQRLIRLKVAAARRYATEVVAEFERTHSGSVLSLAAAAPSALPAAAPKPVATTAPDAIPELF